MTIVGVILTGAGWRIAALLALSARREAVLISVAAAVPEAHAGAVADVEEPHDRVLVT